MTAQTAFKGFLPLPREMPEISIDMWVTLPGTEAEKVGQRLYRCPTFPLNISA